MAFTNTKENGLEALIAKRLVEQNRLCQYLCVNSFPVIFRLFHKCYLEEHMVRTLR